MFDHGKPNLINTATDNSISFADNDADTTPILRGSAWWRWLLMRFYNAIGRPPFRIRLWNNAEIAHPQAEFTLTLHNRRAFYLLLLRPDLYFGDGYAHAQLSVEGDLVKFLEAVYRGTNVINKPRWRRVLKNIFTRAHSNSLRHAKHNIYHHYDLGNRFYERWLDRAAMQYTCAYFPSAAYNLEQAQLAKMEHVCRKLQLKPGEKVVEAGCGWGGLARYMAKQYGVQVHAYNISHEQIAYARAKAKEEKLDHLVEYVEEDYRNINGHFDVFVSIGMLEHVGIGNFRTLHQVINRGLSPTGRGLIHTIGRNQAEKINAWIEKRIFPGSEPPSLRQMMELFEDAFSVLDVENLRLHYAETLIHWQMRFNQQAADIEREYDAEFIRTWQLYLAGSIAGFTTGTLQLFQVLFTRADNNDIAWSRQHLYKGST